MQPDATRFASARLRRVRTGVRRGREGLAGVPDGRRSAGGRDLLPKLREARVWRTPQRIAVIGSALNDRIAGQEKRGYVFFVIEAGRAAVVQEERTARTGSGRSPSAENKSRTNGGLSPSGRWASAASAPPGQLSR